MIENHMLLEGCCSTDSISLLQIYTKNVKKPNFLLKKNLVNGKNNHRLGKNEVKFYII